MDTVSALRKRFSRAVLSNNVIPDIRWNQPCEAYNIQILLGCSKGNNIFASFQDEISNIERENLHRCCAESLHISIAWIIAVQQDYCRPRWELWEEIRDEIYTQLINISNDITEFKIRYTKLVATDTAIIAVAEDNGNIDKLRKAINEQLSIPDETSNKSNIIHTTLFRYSSSLDYPERFHSLVSSVNLGFEVTVDNISIQKELVYPSIVAETLFQIKLHQ